MLETLRIKNYALIDDIEVVFREQFNVLTGETGAGKSIIVGALNLVLGARASSEVVRNGCKSAKIDALFRLTDISPRLAEILDEHALELEGDELLVSRVVSAEGRNRAYAASTLISVSVLSRIGDELVDMHGQHEHQSLLKADRQLDLLDGYAKTAADAASVGEQVAELRVIAAQIEALESDDRERARRVDFLKFEVKEIDDARPVAGEEEDLQSRRNLIVNAEKIFSVASAAHRRFSEAEDGASALDAVGGAVRDLEELASVDGRFAVLSDQAQRVYAEIEAIAEELRGYTTEVEYSPQELDEVNLRLTKLAELKRKYGDTVEAILGYRDRAREEIDGFENRDLRLAELGEQKAKVEKRAMAGAKTLSKRRKRAARELDKKVASALHELGMEGAQFETRIEAADLSRTGVDRVGFYLSANPGEKLKPLRQVASGGEVSRIMLALKVVFANADMIPTLIFDEIDAGVGGAVATKVADKLAELAQFHQTICITHLPQIAAAAATHYHVWKATKDGTTATGVARVEDDARVNELARLLDGSLTEVSRDHARALLTKAS